MTWRRASDKPLTKTIWPRRPTMYTLGMNESTIDYPDSLQWRHNGHDSVSNHQPHDCLLNRLFRRRSKKTSKFRVTGLCAGNPLGTGEFPAKNGQLRGKCFHLMTSWCDVFLGSAHQLHIHVVCNRETNFGFPHDMDNLSSFLANFMETHLVDSSKRACEAELAAFVVVSLNKLFNKQWI